MSREDFINQVLWNMVKNAALLGTFILALRIG